MPLPKSSTPQDVESDRRYLPRWNCHCKIHAYPPGIDNPVNGHTINLGTNGGCFHIPCEVRLNDRVRTVIYLSEVNVVTMDGIVVWKKGSPEATEIGLRFVDINSGSQETILRNAFQSDRETLVRHWYEGWAG